MARITSEEKQRRKEKYDALILDIFLNEGWTALSYDRLARDLSMSKSTLQRYYPARSYFASALQGEIMPIIVQHLELHDTEAFIASWKKALSEVPVFRNVIRMFLENMLSNSPHPSSQKGIEGLVKLMMGYVTEEEARKAIDQVLGTSFLSMSTFTTIRKNNK